MSFYQQFSKYYDYIFPTGDNQISFIKHWVKKGSSVLDIACATGGYSIALTKQGYEVEGIDLDDSMIAIAIDKAIKEGLEIAFKTGDMKAVDSVYNKKFDGAFCIGNSFVHLKDEAEMLRALQAFSRVLKDRGILIIQNINYDRILDNKVDSLPTINNEETGISFVRRYSYLEDINRISFDTTLTINNDKSYENSVQLYPLRQKEFEDLLLKAGYKIIGFYGSFNKEDTYTNESYGMVAVAAKEY